MAKGRASVQTRPVAGRPAAAKPVGPPVLLVVLGYISVLVSLPLIGADGIAAHVVGYVTGALIPIVLIGVIRRVDLRRRRSAQYVAASWLQPSLVVLAIAAVVAAGLHVWPIATELAS